MVAEVLISWLNDAYAMEQAQIAFLERCSTDFERYPEIRSEIRQHLLETKKQANDIKECIASLEGELQEASPQAHTIAHIAESATSGQHNDELVKSMIALHASEHFEHATYTALSEAARALGEDEVADICERIAEEEYAMAEWTEEQIPVVVANYMASVREEV